MTQLDNLKYLTQLQKTIDFCIELQNALMYPLKDHRPIKELTEDASGQCYITNKLLDEQPPKD